MWAINKKTNVKYNFTDEYYEKYFINDPDIEKLAGKIEEPKKLTLKQLKLEAKKAGITGSDRMNKEEIESLLIED